MTLSQRLSMHAHDLDSSGHHPWSSLPSGSDTLTLAFVMDGGGSDIPTGSKGSVPLFFNCDIVAVTLLANASGSCTMDISKDSYGLYPTNVSITNSSKPTLSSAIKYQDTVLSGWSTAISMNDVLKFNVDSLTGISQLTCALELRKV